MLPPIPPTPRAPRARILFPLILALVLIFSLSIGFAIPAIAEAVEPLTTTISFDKTTVAVGEPVTATWAITGGVAPYKDIYYCWYAISGGSYLSEESGYLPNTTTSCSFTPTRGEKCELYLSVKDADGRSRVTTKNLPVTGAEIIAPLTTTISFDKTTVAVGEPVTATWAITGGVAPYKDIYYCWYAISGGSYLSEESGYLPNTTTSCSFTPTKGEKCELYLSVKDTDGRSRVTTKNLPVYIHATGITLDNYTSTMDIGDKMPLTATISPSSGTLKTISWSSSDSSIATVSNTGLVTAVSEGEATITASTTDGSGLNAKCVITVNPPILVASVSISGSSERLEYGGTRQLSATVLPEDAMNKTIAWSSSDESVATVDGTGLVSAVAAGETTITAAATDGSDVRDTRTITVDPPIPVTSVSISGPEGPLAVGAKYRLTASVLPENAMFKAITWSTDKPSVATVEDGLVTGVAKGTAVITATAPSGAKADWNVTVSSTASRLRAFAHDPGLTVAYSRWCLYFKVGAQYGVPPYTLDVIVEKDGVQAAKTTLTTSGSTDLTFTGILSTAVYTMKVTATDAAGRTDSASCSVNVYVGGGNLNVTTLSETEPVSALTGLSFQNATATIAIGSTLTLSPVVSPSGAPRPALEWDSDNPAAVTVSDSGVASAIAEGTSVITAYATDGSGLYARCTVKAIRPVSGVTLNQASAKLTSVGQTVTLQATVLPANATDRGLTWSTNSAAVATVSGGVVTAKGDGTATITATAKDGTGKSASCIVTVDTSIPVASVSLPASKTVRTYESIRLTPTILPENATNKAVTWSSSDASIASVAAQGDGIVTGQRDGTAIITAKTANGLKASCNVTVQATASGLNAFAYNLAAEISGSLALNCTVGAQNGTPPYKLDISLEKNGTSIYTASYTTNDSKRISIPMGAIPAANYTVAVTVTDAEGRIDLSGASAYISAVIGNSTLVKDWEDPPYSYITSLRFENSAQPLAIGQTDWLNISYSPSDAPYPPLVWSSSNPAAVTVSDSAITGVSKGSSVITVRTTDGSNLSASCTVTACPNVDSVSLSPKELKLIQDDTATLTATLLPADTGFKSVTWSSTNSAVASVNGGVVTGHKDGTAIVTAWSSNGKRASCTVTVSNRIESIELMPRDVPLDLPLVNGAYELNLKDTFQLTPQTVPANVGASFTYKPSNPKVLSVNSQGLVTGLKAGNCTLTITARNASTAAAPTKTMNIRVIVPAASVRMDPGFTLFKGTSRKLKASVSPPSATYRQLKWSSSNKSVATVDLATGNVYGVSPGTADIIATAHNGVYFTRQIRVTLPVGSITLTAPDKVIYVGGTTQITPTVLPAEDVDDSLNWTSGSTKIATVGQDGLVTGKGPGTVKITAAATDGSKKSGSLVLKVVKPASFISIKDALTLYTNGKATEKLAITASPAKSGYLSVTWLSDKPSIASVDQNGVVTAHADGTAIISVTTDGEPGKTATCTVTVWTYPSYIKLNLPVELKVGGKLQLIPPLVVELNGSMRSLTWKSSKPNLATIDKKGVLTAKKPGLVEIRVTTANGLSAKAKLNITK